MKKITIFLLSMFFAASFFTVKVFASDEFGDVDIHGFISQGYLYSDDHKYLLADTDDGTFEFNEMGISFATKINADLRIGMQLLSRDLGSIGDDDVEIDWAYADYRYRNWLGIRVGKIKQPGGIYNQSRDVDAARTCVLLPSSIYDEQFREASLTAKGVGFYGMLPGFIDYQVVYGVRTIPLDGGLVHSIEHAAPAIRIDDLDVDAGFTGELFWNTPLDGLRVGYAYAKADVDMHINEYDFNAAEVAVIEAAQGLFPGTIPPGWMNVDIPMPVEFKWDRFSVEYTYENFVISSEYNSTELDIGWRGEESEDYYVMTTYRFTDWFELGFYYSAHYAQKDDKDGKKAQAAYDAWIAEGGSTPAAPLKPLGSLQFKEMGYLEDYAISMRFDVNIYWIVKIEFHMMDGLNGLDFSESDDPNDPDPYWTLFAVKASYSF